MNKNAICFDRLSRDFGSVRALSELSLEVPAGMIFGFLGPNGAGKTTTIRLLLGLIEPSSGRAEVLGFDTKTAAETIRAQSGALLEHTGLYEQLSAEENLEFFGRIYQLPAGQRQERVKELLESIGLWERRKEPVRFWSRGMKQKLALARAQLHYPALILLDEPTAGLDVAAAKDVRRQLLSLVTEHGTTIFLTTHNMAEAEKLCSLVAVIRQGSLIAFGHPNELSKEIHAPRLEIQAHGVTEQVLNAMRARPEVGGIATSNGRMVIDLQCDADTSALVDLLVKAGVQVKEVYRSQASLEEVFLTLTQEEQSWKIS